MDFPEPVAPVIIIARLFIKLFLGVAPPEATPSPFAISSLRYAPLRPANALRAAQRTKKEPQKRPLIQLPRNVIAD